MTFKYGLYNNLEHDVKTQVVMMNHSPVCQLRV